MLGDLLGELTEKAVSAFHSSGVPYAVCGGVAIALSGRGRSTRDLDVLALMSTREVSAFIEAAREAGFSHQERVDRHALDDVVLYRFWLPVRDTGLSTSLDLQVGSSDFHREAVARALRVTLSGLEVRVAAPEDLILMKLSAFRPIDRADAIDILNLNPVDSDYLRSWAGRLGVEDRLKDVMDGAQNL